MGRKINEIFMLIGLMMIFALFLFISVKALRFKYRDYLQNDIKPYAVSEIPDGFIPYNYISDEYKDILTIGFFESQVYVLDMDNINLFQTYSGDKNFLVKYKNEFYYNKQKIDELLIIAEDTLQKRNRIYEIGEDIDLYDEWKKPIVICAREVSYTDSFENTEINDDEWLCVVELKLGDIDSYFNPVWKYFKSAETHDGQIINEAEEIDSEYLVIRVPKNKKIKMLTICCPLLHSAERKINVYESADDLGAAASGGALLLYADNNLVRAKV